MIRRAISQIHFVKRPSSGHIKRHYTALVNSIPEEATSTGPTFENRNERLALENYLLRKDLDHIRGKQTDMDGKNDEIKDELSAEMNEIVDTNAKMTIMPSVDRYWMPKPLLFRHLRLPAGYLAQLEDIEHKLRIPCKTRLLFLQAFIHSSMVEKLAEKGKISATEGRLITQERLIPFGEEIIRLSVMHMLFERNPQLRPTVIRDLLQKTSESIIVGNIAKDLGISTLVQYVPEKTAQTDYEINADLLRALLGAVYLDVGMVEALKFSYHKVTPQLMRNVDNFLKFFRK